MSCVIPDTPTAKFGEALRQQVEERLNFFETGEPPSKNADAMRKVFEQLALDEDESDSEDEDEIAALVKPNLPRPSSVAVARVRASSGSPAPGKLTSKAPRMTKKALQELELQRRRAYAETFFKELNETVFKGGIPPETKLEWNKRLLTTAGRAHWHRCVGVDSTQGRPRLDAMVAGRETACTQRLSNLRRRSSTVMVGHPVPLSYGLAPYAS